MGALTTIQKQGNLNIVEVTGNKGAGGAYHSYSIRRIDTEKIISEIEFQHGARIDPDAQHGVIDADLLEIVRHRLQHFQQGEFATRENAIALTHIEEALLWMNKRVEDRIERNVLATYKK